jgi:site-specific DNA-methyltransferase (adenine-specific)
VSLHHGNCREVLRSLADASIDSCVTDPPYELTSARPGGRSPATEGKVMKGFMGMAWDGTGVANDVGMWAEVLRVLKPGGYLLAFSGTRTYHRMVCAIEDAGFEIRDQIGWAFGSGFPKSHNGEWGGTALKPAWEPICVARKPLIGTVEANWLAHGTGALNIDGCRIQTDEALRAGAGGTWDALHQHEGRAGEVSAQRRYQDKGGTNFAATPGPRGGDAAGRWPANLCHDGSDEVLAAFPREAGAAAPVHKRNGDKFRNAFGAFAGNLDEGGSTYHADTGSAARFFYCAKASREDRNEGCEHFAKQPLLWSAGEQNPGSFQADGTDRSAHNHHPTVKPTDLMRWLVRLVTPKGGIVLDPFMGSGSTGKACALEGLQFIGIEQEGEYIAIAQARIDCAMRQGHQPALL